jgi:biopolymer transport protein ExbD
LELNLNLSIFVMQQVIRLIHISLLIAVMTAGVWAKEDAPPTTHMAEREYQRADSNFYPKAEFLKADPSAVIIPKGKYTQKGDSYFFTPRIRAPKAIYIEVSNDWIEPITPPDMPASLGVPPDAMQIREPQGDVQVALPSAPGNFAPVTDGMTLPNGAVVKTGANGTTAVLFGGVDSARLMPNSAAAVQQTVTAQSRSAEVDLTAGGVFSKVGTQVGVKGEYEVHTPFGNAVAAGGDFVTSITSDRVDVWVAQGTVSLVNPSESKAAATVTSNGSGPLKILRRAGVADSLTADVETLTAVLNFIPMANQKIKALYEKQRGGATLTANEQAYLGRIKQMPSLIKLALVEPPAAPAPAVVSAPAAAPAPPPVKLEPIELNLRPDGSVDFQNATLTLDDLKPKLEEIAKATPTQHLVIKGREKVTHDQLKKVVAICRASKLKVTVAKAVPTAPPPLAPAAAAVPTSEPAAPNPSAPAAPPAPAAEPAATNAPASAAPSAPGATIPANSGPLRVVVRMDGKINFQKVTLTPAQFQSRLEAIIKATPDQAILLKAGKKVPYEKFKAALDICQSAQVKNLTIATPAPTPESAAAPAATEPATTNLPAPTLLMHPAMESPSSNAPETPSAPPTTNAPPTSVP